MHVKTTKNNPNQGPRIATKTLTSRTKRVARRELPHAGEELAEAADEEGHADDDVGGGDVVGLDVDEREDEGGGGEGEEAAGGRELHVSLRYGENGIGDAIWRRAERRRAQWEEKEDTPDGPHVQRPASPARPSAAHLRTLERKTHGAREAPLDASSCLLNENSTRTGDARSE